MFITFYGTLSSKYFLKLPPPFNTIIEEKWNKKYGMVFQIRIVPRIVFTFKYLKEQCITDEVAKQVKNYNYCKNVYIPGVYKDNKKKKYLRRATNYKKGILRKNHVSRFKNKKPPIRKCKCFICGQIGHYVRECRNKKVDVERVTAYRDLELEDEFDIVSCNGSEASDDSDVLSICDRTEEVEDKLSFEEQLRQLTI